MPRRKRRIAQLDEAIADTKNDFDPIEQRHFVKALLGRLLALGIKREVAIAFVLTGAGLSSQQVAAHLRRSMRVNVSAATVRQWKRRRFPAVLAKLPKQDGAASCADNL